MSLRPLPVDPIPPLAQRIAQAAFPKGSLFLQMREELGSIFTDDDFQALYSRRGKPALEPWRLALITIMQFVENLSDRQTAEAVRARIDWKYALSLELDDAGFDFSRRASQRLTALPLLGIAQDALTAPCHCQRHECIARRELLERDPSGADP